MLLKGSRGQAGLKMNRLTTSASFGPVQGFAFGRRGPPTLAFRNPSSRAGLIRRGSYDDDETIVVEGREYCGVKRATLAGVVMIPLAVLITFLSAKKAKSEVVGMQLHRRDRQGDDMSAQVELARNYQFSCPEAWQVEKVSRTDADAYGTDYRVSGREGTIDVSIYPFSGSSTSQDMKRFLLRTQLGPSADMYSAAVVSESTRKTKTGTLFLFETDSPHAVIAATPVENALYVAHVTPKSSRSWKGMRDAFVAAAQSFEVL